MLVLITLPAVFHGAAVHVPVHVTVYVAVPVRRDRFAVSARAAAGQSGATLADVARAALKGAEEGVEATRSMTPKYGKAAVFASQAIGVEDQGAVAGKLMVQGLAQGICGKEAL